VPWTQQLLVRCLYLLVGLALVFAGIGFLEFATKHLLISNAKVLSANEIKPYFRVNSLFFDPNIYGRFLALVLIVLATRLLWSSRGRDTIITGVLLAVLWAGLVLSLSQSSFAALLVGLAVLAALRWKVWPVAAVVVAAVAAGLILAIAAPGVLHLKGGTKSALDKATSGRYDLISGGWRMFVARPVWGYGSGGFEATYRKREHVRAKRVAAVSHTIPITVAAEQGVVGLAVYLALLVAAFMRLLSAGVRASPARAFAAAAFAGLVAHTLLYAAFLEDPMTWALLAFGVALAAPRPASRTLPDLAVELRPPVGAPAP